MWDENMQDMKDGWIGIRLASGMYDEWIIWPAWVSSWAFMLFCESMMRADR